MGLACCLFGTVFCAACLKEFRMAWKVLTPCPIADIAAVCRGKIMGLACCLFGTVFCAACLKEFRMAWKVLTPCPIADIAAACRGKPTCRTVRISVPLSESTRVYLSRRRNWTQDDSLPSLYKIARRHNGEHIVPARR